MHKSRFFQDEKFSNSFRVSQIQMGYKRSVQTVATLTNFLTAFDGSNIKGLSLINNKYIITWYVYMLHHWKKEIHFQNKSKIKRGAKSKRTEPSLQQNIHRVHVQYRPFLTKSKEQALKTHILFYLHFRIQESNVCTLIINYL